MVCYDGIMEYLVTMENKDGNEGARLEVFKVLFQTRSQRFRREMSKEGDNVQNSKLTTEDHIVDLNIGGYKYTTSASTLHSRGANFLTLLINNDREGKIPAKRDEEGCIWVDRNGKAFEVILEYLRTGKLFIPPDMPKGQIEAELDFYQIKPHLSLKESTRDPEILTFYELVDKQATKINNSVSKWLELNQTKIFALLKRDLREDSPRTEVSLHFHIDYSRTSSLGTPWVCDTRVSLMLPPDYVPSEPTAVMNSAWMKVLCYTVFVDWQMQCRFLCSGGPPKLQLTLDWGSLICPSLAKSEEVQKFLQSMYIETTTGPALRSVSSPTNRF